MAEKNKQKSSVKNIKITSKKNKAQKNKVSVGKLKTLITIIPRNKVEFYEDIIQSHGANMQMTLFGKGTANSSMLSQKALDFVGSEKAIILSVLKEEFIEKTIETLEEKFKTVRNGKGIAFTIPLSSIIGASAYSFLADNKTLIKKEK